MIDGAEKIPVKECGEKLISLNGILPSQIVLEDDFFNRSRQLQKTQPEVFVREGVAQRLIKAAGILQERFGKTYQFLIYRAFSTFEEQLDQYNRVLQIIKDKNPTADDSEIQKIVSRFVSKPSNQPENPSPHITGGSLDLTVIKNGKLLEMAPSGSLYTEISETDYYNNATDEKGLLYKINRQVLLQPLLEAGFTNYYRERWHFDYGNQFWGKIVGKEAIYGPAEQFYSQIRQAA